MKHENLTYCTDLVRSLNRDVFLQSLLLAPETRSAVIAIAALDAELRHVHSAVSEEMLGHIRFAWWKEGVEAIANGEPARAHPVLQLLGELKIPANILLPLVKEYLEAYPNWPENPQKTLDIVCSQWIEAHAPQQLKAWYKAGKIIERHRKKYTANNGWLALKLFVISFVE